VELPELRVPGGGEGGKAEGGEHVRFSRNVRKESSQIDYIGMGGNNSTINKTAAHLELPPREMERRAALRRFATGEKRKKERNRVKQLSGKGESDLVGSL